MIKKILLSFIIYLGIHNIIMGEVIEAIVARVNDEVITLTQVKQVESDILRSLSVSYEGDELTMRFEQMRNKIINNVIEERLLIQKAKEKGIDVEQDVNESIERLKKENNIQSNEELIAALKQEGLTIEDLKKQLRERTMQQKLLFYYLQGKISITEQEMKKYYEENKNKYEEPASYRIGHIFISFNDRTKEQAFDIANEVINKIKSGEDFNKLAKEYSDDASRDKGGDLGFLAKTELNDDLVDKIDLIPIGEISELIESEDGYHIFKIIEKVESRIKTYEEVRDNIYQNIFNERAVKYQDEFMEKLKKESFIEIIYDPYKE